MRGKKRMNHAPPQPESPWPHRLAVALVCATFPLVWVGGLVTTHDAGMAVPDWPNTYGYNLFLYPWTEWFAGPWDLFIEHAHRLFAALVGLLCIVFVIVVWRAESRRWVRNAALVALGLVVAQGVLGGLRVVLDERTLAMIHGCVGPLFFTYCVLLATITSQSWREERRNTAGDSRSAAVLAAASITTILAYMQLVAGAQLRHVGASIAPTTFRALVVFHLIGAGALLIGTAYLAVCAKGGVVNDRWLRVPARWLVALVALQIALGGGAWVVNYGWPAWFGEYPWAAQWLVNADGAIAAKGHIQANLTTAHVATGSLILAIAAMIALRAARLTGRWQTSPSPSFVQSGAAA
jgi:cytochrome c oxidase assembly protein subunit 15